MFDDERLKIRHRNWKVNMIFLILIVVNMVFFGELIYYLIYHSSKFHLDIHFVKNSVSLISTLIILGFISTRLPQFRKLNDSSFYELGYLIIIGILSIVISHFNESTHSAGIVTPFLEMFKVLSVILIITIIATKTTPFKERIKGKITLKNQIICLFIFIALGIIASKYNVHINDTPVNVRDFVIMIGGLFGGPVVGIPAGIVSALFRLTQGGHTAIPCAISTVLAGIIGSLIFIWNDKRFLRPIPSILLMFLFTGVDMLLIILLTPDYISIRYVASIYPLMLFGYLMGMILFLMIIKEEKQGNKSEISYEELKIREIENVLDEYSDRIEELEEKIEELENGSEEEADE